MTKTRPSITTARKYLRGLLQTDRRNMERMEQAVPNTNEQALQHFISNSPWDAEAVMRQVARGADALLGGHDDTLLVINESGIHSRHRSLLPRVNRSGGLRCRFGCHHRDQTLGR